MRASDRCKFGDPVQKGMRRNTAFTAKFTVMGKKLHPTVDTLIETNYYTVDLLFSSTPSGYPAGPTPYGANEESLEFTKLETFVNNYVGGICAMKAGAVP
jgi:hypothetical protein